MRPRDDVGKDIIDEVREHCAEAKETRAGLHMRMSCDPFTSTCIQCSGYRTTIMLTTLPNGRHTIVLGANSCKRSPVGSVAADKATAFTHGGRPGPNLQKYGWGHEVGRS
jgi:hypothetical protein